MSGEAARLRAAFDMLGIAPKQIRARGLKRHREARRLVPVGLGTDGRDKFLLKDAAQAWLAMREAAREDGIELLLVSAFRSIEFQTALIRAKLDRGLALDEVLRVNAPPGYSEHHSGRALDLGVAGRAALDEAFEHTAAFAWLRAHAHRFGFSLSYPRDNAQGYLHEPWHWCFRR
ncbi:M15 family metallopeptidase [Sinimarinibacterium flocculans]|uniref:D-Ala-D-Ala carboxypeptidase n=1 Tax=Sinimarinibacterium flocculans TaxID=985250 RepID=A0A318EDT2_9GAMM|nr:M15 family metallopeptidase [Sinimarinibacterium flocculans]PXV70663.1 D-Ala-D-Ala carboxypeptidase [Sinimarinibacterium flocculans]